jgi:TP901 family phage tail tape measure protein
VADRSITYEFKAKFDSFRSQLVAGGRSVDDFGKKLTALDKNGAKMRAGLSTLGDFGGKIALGAAGGLAAIVGVTAHFDSAMSKVAAATGEGEAGMKRLRDAALQAGADTAFSASEAADAITALSKAGVSTSDILAGGLNGSLSLAAAGELDVAQAAEIAATTMTQFGLKGQDVGHIADVLAAAAGKAQGEVTDMAEALNYVGPVAHQMGISLEETGGAIAELASQGILGSQAGTSLRGMLTSLTSPSKIAKETMEDYGISLYDAQGKMIGFKGIAQQLHQSMGDLSESERNEALGRIFGNEQITAARILYAGGAKDVDKWTKAVDDSGFAADQAAKKMDNLAGDWEQLTGSIETALIGMGDSSQGPLRKLVQSMTDTVNAFSDLPGPMKDATTIGLGLIAVLGSSVFVGSKVANGIAATQEAMQNLGFSEEQATRTTKVLSRAMGAAAGVGLFAVGMSNANDALGSFEATAGGVLAGFSVGGGWGAAIGGVAALFASLVHHADDGVAAIEEVTDSLDEQTGALTANTRAIVQKKLFDAGAYDAAKTLGLNLATVTDAALGNAEALDIVNAALARYQGTASHVVGGRGVGAAGVAPPTVTAQQAQAAEDLGHAIGDTNVVIDQSTKRWKDNKEAAGGASDATGGMSRQARNAGNAAGKAAPQIKKMSEAMAAAREDAESAAREFFGLGEKVDKAKVSLNGWIRDLRKQADALRNFRENAQAAAIKGLDEGLIASLEEAGPAGALRMRQLANSTGTEIERANKAWRTGEREVRRYTDTVGGVPKTKATQFTAKGAAKVVSDVLRMQKRYNLTPKEVRTLFKQEGVPASLKGVARIVAANKKIDNKTVKSLVKILGVDATVAQVRNAAKEIDKAGNKSAHPKIAVDTGPFLADFLHANRTIEDTDKKSAHPKITLDGLPLFNQQIAGAHNAIVNLDGDHADTYIYTHHVDTHSGGRADGGTIGYAFGGTVAGARYPYADKVATMLAPTEEVTSNRYGQATRFRPELKAINAWRPGQPDPLGRVYAQPGSGGGAGGGHTVVVRDRFPRNVRLNVRGQEFDAYVEYIAADAAADAIEGAEMMSAEIGRAG